MLVPGLARVGVAAAGTHFAQDQGTRAVFLVLDLHGGRLHHGLVPAEPHHLRVGISCKDIGRDFYDLTLLTEFCLDLYHRQVPAGSEAELSQTLLPFTRLKLKKVSDGA